MSLATVILAAIVLTALGVWIYAAHKFCLLCAEAAREDAGDQVADGQGAADAWDEIRFHEEHN